ncbi:MAG: spore coat protein U domain-containing protein [Pseudomonadota bacterium]
MNLRQRTVFAVLAFGLTAMACPARAAGSHTLSVGATILSKNQCKFTNGGPTALAFGAIDPSSPADSTATATTTFKCTGSSPMATYQITSDDGLYETSTSAPRMRHGTNLAEFLPYSINLPQSATVPKNVTQTLTVNGTILAAQFQNALAGAYSDTVVLTISP